MLREGHRIKEEKTLMGFNPIGKQSVKREKLKDRENTGFRKQCPGALAQAKDHPIGYFEAPPTLSSNWGLLVGTGRRFHPPPHHPFFDFVQRQRPLGIGLRTILSVCDHIQTRQGIEVEREASRLVYGLLRSRSPSQRPPHHLIYPKLGHVPTLLVNQVCHRLGM